VSWEFHPARESFARFAADWDRLNADLHGNHPYYDSRFVGPLLKYFGDSRELLCLYRAEGIIQSALILQPRGGGRWVAFRPAQAQITPVLLGDSNLLNVLFVALPGFAWSIELYAVDPRFAPKFSNARGTMVVSEHYTTILVSQESGFNVYWEQRPKKLRSNIRRYKNRLEQEGVLAELTLIKSLRAMPDSVRRFGELESKGWKAAKGTAISIDNVQGRFYAEVLTNFAANGEAKIYELTIDGQLAASRMLIGNERMLVSLKISYDEVLARFSPGWLLLERMLRRQLTEHPSLAVEFYTNASREQSEWATARQVIQDIHVFRNDLAIAFFTLAKSYVRCLKGNRSSPPIQEREVEVAVSCSKTIVGLPEGHIADWCLPRLSIEESLDWFGLLQSQVYSDDQGVIYCYACEGGCLTAVLPLRQIRQRGVRILESLSNYYTSLYVPLFSAEMQPHVLQAMLTSGARQSGGAHVMRFAPMDPESSEYAGLLQALRDSGWVPLTFFCFGNWFLKVEGGWAGYLKNRGGNLRSSIKRRTRDFLAEDGTLEIVTGTQDLDAAIAAYNKVYAASWKKPEPYTYFVPSLIKLVAARGMLRLGIARLHGEPIGAQLWIVGKDKASIYKVAYDEAYSEYSPGTVLTSFLMKHVIEVDGVAEVDFLIGDDSYKKLWMSHRRERWGIIAYNPRTFFGCVLLAKELVGRTLKPIAVKLMRSMKSSKIKLLDWLPDFRKNTKKPQNDPDKESK
jgi:CelD/BcsL family acetyltransferase involved in cellulose biosynthesis